MKKKLIISFIIFLIIMLFTLPKITYAIDNYEECFKIALFGIPGTYDGKTIYKDPSGAKKRFNSR